MGVIIGRFVNCIVDVFFIIDRKIFYLEVNDGNNINYGGFFGFYNKVWQWEELLDGICFSLYLLDGEGGFLGNICVIIDYCFNEDNEFFVLYYVEIDCVIYINMINYVYFNLCGKGKKIMEYWLYILVDWILDMILVFIFIGRKMKVKNILFDFIFLKMIGVDLYVDYE